MLPYSLPSGRGLPAPLACKLNGAADFLVSDLALQCLSALAARTGWGDGPRCQEGRDPGLDGLTERSSRRWRGRRQAPALMAVPNGQLMLGEMPGLSPGTPLPALWQLRLG